MASMVFQNSSTLFIEGRIAGDELTIYSEIDDDEIEYKSERETIISGNELRKLLCIFGFSMDERLSDHQILETIKNAKFLEQTMKDNDIKYQIKSLY